MSELKNRIIENLIKRRDKVLNGGINCIPSPFTRFRSEFPGIEKSMIYLVSGASKSGKSQITLYLFVINTVIYCYLNPNKVKPKIFFFPLEEDKESITLKVMAFFINYVTNGRVIISPTDLKSTDERKPLSDDILEIMNNPKFNELMDLYEKIVIFSDEGNRVGAYKVLQNYAETHGTFHYKEVTAKEKDELGIIREVPKQIFDYYVPNDPDEIVIAIHDHLSLLSPVRGEDLRQTISLFAEDCIKLRNRCGMSFVWVQQQNLESIGLEAFKANKIRPTLAGLSDCKDTGKACNVMFGITNPHSFEMQEYLGYPIAGKLKGNARFLEAVLNRNGNSNGICPLLFFGEINRFVELPPPTDTNNINRIVTNLINQRQERTRNNLALTLFSWAKQKFNLNNKNKNE